MATKNAGKPQKRELPKITAKIDRMLDFGEGKVKAIASANIGGVFAVHGIKVIDSKNGLFAQMPQTSYEKDGERKYSDIFHAVTADAREALLSAVMKAYEQEQAEMESVDEDEELPFGPEM